MYAVVVWKYWPIELKENKRKRRSEDPIRSLIRGEHLARQTRDGKITAIVWQDSRLVYTLATTYNVTAQKAPATEVSRRNRNAEGMWEKQNIPCPDAIWNFNKWMGGVDSHDHLRSSYSAQRPSVKWWHYFFWFAIDMALINSYLIYSKSHPKVTHKKFQLQVRKC